ncbi:MAG: phosphomannose isomerase type II C-terminal cupin domain [Candidatus Thermoplasmatota archaeon]
MDPLRAALTRLGLAEGADIQERPWGLWVDWFRSPEATLKAMVVRPGARMSLQKHAARSEVWHIVSGVGEDQGTNPPTPLRPGVNRVVTSGAVHRIANTGTEPLVIVEMQMGRCDEHDIVRLADDYARA